RRLHRHRRALAEGTVEQQPLTSRLREFVEHAAFADVLLQARIGHVKRAWDCAMALALAAFTQIDQGDVRISDEANGLQGGYGPAAARYFFLMEADFHVG